MSVFAGVRKLSDVASQVIVELSTNSDSLVGSWNFVTLTSGKYYFQLDGNLGRFDLQPNTLNSAPQTNTLSCMYDFLQSGRLLEALPKINNIVPAVTAGGVADAGTGNFGNYPLYFGMRAGTSLPFSGQEYQMIIVGKTLSAAQITSTETFVNNRTKAY